MRRGRGRPISRLPGEPDRGGRGDRDRFGLRPSLRVQGSSHAGRQRRRTADACATAECSDLASARGRYRGDDRQAVVRRRPGDRAGGSATAIVRSRLCRARRRADGDRRDDGLCRRGLPDPKGAGAYGALGGAGRCARCGARLPPPGQLGTGLARQALQARRAPGCQRRRQARIGRVGRATRAGTARRSERRRSLARACSSTQVKNCMVAEPRPRRRLRDEWRGQIRPDLNRPARPLLWNARAASPVSDSSTTAGRVRPPPRRSCRCSTWSPRAPRRSGPCCPIAQGGASARR